MQDRLWRDAAFVVWICFGCAAAALADDAAAPPVVPGYSQLKTSGKTGPSAMGELLLSELNCAACHSAEHAKRIDFKGAPDLSNAGARLTPQYIRQFLATPHQIKPGTTMPDLMHASDPTGKKVEIENLTHFLVSRAGPIGRSAEDGNQILVKRGRVLYHSIGCIACHAPENAGPLKIPPVPLPKLAMKTTVDQLTDFLMNPTKVRPASRMPSLHLEKEEATAIAVYLLRAQLENPQTSQSPPARTHGMKYEYYEEPIVNSCRIEDLDRLKPKSTGRITNFHLNIPGRRNERFAVKFSGAIAIPKDGKYTFSTLSDDGSRLYLDGKSLIDNDGEHGPGERTQAIDLTAGDHPITVCFFQAGSGFELKVQWEGPGVPRQIIPPAVLFNFGGKSMVPLESETFVVDPDKASTGEKMFAVMGCAACHAIPGLKSAREVKALLSLNPDAPEGCLGEHPGKGTPNFDLSADQTAAIKAALKIGADLDKPRGPKDQVVHQLAQMNCFACHIRDGVGGPAADRDKYFVMSGTFDMGDEGRIPPRLTGAGEKLKNSAIEQIVFEGKLHVRPVLATRMPQFNRDRLTGLAQNLAAADGPEEDVNPKFSEVLVHDGRTLVGSKGLGCVNCHGVGDVKSLGMPAPNLSSMSDRLRPGWFHKLMTNPIAVNPGTRMPSFWDKGDVAFKNLAGGTEGGQIDSIWEYASLGKSMPLPAGLAPTAGYELVPTDEPIVHRTFMAEVGPRAIAVGFPEMLHVAFDANVVRLAKAWHGRFFDARGMWDSRGGQSLGPLGPDVINLPPGPSFAVLPAADSPWPTPKANERNLGGKFKGYALDKDDRPVFHYLLNGVQIEEQPMPELKTGGAVLMRKFHLVSKDAPQGMYFLAASGRSIDAKSPGEWLVDAKVAVRIDSKAAAKATIREANGVKQLLLPIAFNDGQASFDVEMSW